MKKLVTLSSAMLVFAVAALFSHAAGAEIDKGDTSFILMASALVLLMTPALAFFYAGFVKAKNVVNTLTSTMVIAGVISVTWIVIGYTLAFGPDKGRFIGGLDYFMFNGVGTEASGTIPHVTFAIFQMMFAIITPALIVGAVVERMRLVALVSFMALWGTLIYSPLTHWVWGGGFLAEAGLLDFAGGTVVHTSAGVSALVAALVLSKRKGYPSSVGAPNNVPFILLGASVLWFGWFGFNAGSALAADGLASIAFLNTNTAAAVAMLTWMIIEKVRNGKASLSGASIAAVVGLIAITPAAGFVPVGPAMIIGAIAAILSYSAVQLKNKLGYDDSLDVFACHGVAGIWGTLATGLFASEAINGVNGLFFGNPTQFAIQLYGVAATVALCVVGTFIILKVVSLFTKLTADDKTQDEGLDTAIHGEAAYELYEETTSSREKAYN